MRTPAAEKILIVSMACDLIRTRTLQSEREAIRMLSQRFPPLDVARLAGEALRLARRAAAGGGFASLPSERLAHAARGGAGGEAGMTATSPVVIAFPLHRRAAPRPAEGAEAGAETMK